MDDQIKLIALKLWGMLCLFEYCNLPNEKIDQSLMLKPKKSILEIVEGANTQNSEEKLAAIHEVMSILYEWQAQC